MKFVRTISGLCTDMTESAVFKKPQVIDALLTTAQCLGL
jgi:hypothetical protein